jgi:hypothetical protein
VDETKTAPSLYRRLSQIPEVADLVDLLFDAAIEYHQGNTAAGDRISAEFDLAVPGLMRFLEGRAAGGDALAVEALDWFRSVYPKQTN